MYVRAMLGHLRSTSAVRLHLWACVTMHFSNVLFEVFVPGPFWAHTITMSWLLVTPLLASHTYVYTLWSHVYLFRILLSRNVTVTHGLTHPGSSGKQR